MKKYMKIRKMLFKNLKLLFRKTHQTPPKLQEFKLNIYLNRERYKTAQ